jgi:hypothetical protein
MINKVRITKIVIYNNNLNAGGSIALSLLCKLLQDRGYDSRLMVFPWGGNSTRFLLWRNWLIFHSKNWTKRRLNYLCKIVKIKKRFRISDFSYIVGKQCKQEYNPFFNRKSTLVVYPEVLYGNLLGAKNVVRWLLYHYRYSNDTKAYNPNDIFICYRKVFNDWILNPTGIETPLIYLEEGCFRQYNFKERKGFCYLLRKGHLRNDLPKSFDGSVIDFGTPDDEINRLFNECKYCFFYDTQTFYVTYAIICGCIPIIIPEKGKGRHDYLGDNSIGAGIAYGNTEEEILFAINTRNQALRGLENIRSRNDKSIDAFLSILEKKYVIEKNKIVSVQKCSKVV